MHAEMADEADAKIFRMDVLDELMGDTQPGAETLASAGATGAASA